MCEFCGSGCSCGVCGRVSGVADYLDREVEPCDVATLARVLAQLGYEDAEELAGPLRTEFIRRDRSRQSGPWRDVTN